MPNFKQTSLPATLGIDLLQKLSFPAAADLLPDKFTCIICQEFFFTGTSPEIPVKLQCSHIFGISCLTKWISKRDKTRQRNSCPLCRKHIHTGLSVEETCLRRSYEEFAATSIRDPLVDVINDEEKCWAEEAEKLWKTLVEDLVQGLSTITTAYDWLHGNGLQMREVIGLATVQRFHEEWSKEDSNILYDGVAMISSYTPLCNHLRTQDEDQIAFPNPDEGYYVWLGEQHRKIAATHELLKQRLRVEIERP